MRIRILDRSRNISFVQPEYDEAFVLGAFGEFR